ncbi:MAG: MFS transporter [Candidatus Kerfeldbacteria bacterium]|nr:MFS transporter [Candidatus Kerfeldbacteria bacterium]
MLHLIFKPRNRHRILKLLLLGNYFNIFAFALFGPLFTIFALQYDATPFDITVALSLYSLTFGLLIIVFGRVQNSIENKRAIIVSSYFLLTLAAFSFLLVDELWIIYPVQIFNGAVNAWMVPAWKTMYGKYEDQGHESEEWAMADGGNQLLIAAATVLGGALLTLYGFPTLIVLVGVLQLIGAFFSLQVLAPDDAAT